jgi:hypothetical protein
MAGYSIPRETLSDSDGQGGAIGSCIPPLFLCGFNREFSALIRRDEISGAQEFNAMSDDEAQNMSTIEDDSLSNENESVDSPPTGSATPVKKKRRKDGSEMGSTKKKQKVLPINFS